MEKTICFFEITKEGMERFPKLISNEISKKYPKGKFIFMSLYEEEIEEAIFPENSEFVSLSSIDNIEIFFKDKSIYRLVTFAQRIPDMYITYFAKKRNIKSIQVQHGLVIPFMKRTLGFFFDQIGKTLTYSKLALQLSWEKRTPNIFKDLINIFFLGRKTFAESKLSSKHFNSDKFLVYGDYWKKYYAKYFGYDKRQFEICGAPDYRYLEDAEEHTGENTICYICQTLVEDGRLERGKFESFIKTLSNSLPEDYKLYLKKHPRTDEKLYLPLSGRNNVEFTNNFIITDKYLGHYSTMLILPLYLSRETLLWQFEKHDIPNYLKENATSVTGQEESLRNFIIDNYKKNSENQNSIEYYFEYNKNFITCTSRSII